MEVPGSKYAKRIRWSRGMFARSSGILISGNYNLFIYYLTGKKIVYTKKIW